MTDVSSASRVFIIASGSIPAISVPGIIPLWLWAIWSKPITLPATVIMARVSTTQSRNWVRATQATPIIFPNISSVALTLEINTSTTLLAFSSMTEDITIPENIAMNIYITIPRSIETIIFNSAESSFAFPESSMV